MSKQLYQHARKTYDEWVAGNKNALREEVYSTEIDEHYRVAFVLELVNLGLQDSREHHVIYSIEVANQWTNKTA